MQVQPDEMLSSLEVTAAAPMALVAVGPDGRVRFASGAHVDAVCGGPPHVGEDLFTKAEVPTIVVDLIRRALAGVDGHGRFQTADGAMTLRAQLTRAPDGAPERVTVVGMPEVLQASSDEAFMRLFRASPIAISISTLDTGIFSHCNDAFVRDFGYPREEVVGRGSVELGMWSPEQRAAAIAELREKGILVGHESTVRTKAGEVRDVIFNMERIEFAGRFHLVGFFYDITERKRAEEEQRRLYEQLKELDELKGQFLANVSHELRTPLTLIVGLAERAAAREGRAPEDAVDLAGIRRNARSLLKQVNNLLDIARLDAGRIAPSYECVDVAAELRLLASPFDVVARDKAIRYDIVTPDALVAPVDADKLERIALNLLSNAFKFTPARGTVRVELASDEDGFRLVVADSGPGVPPIHRDAVFTRFFQLEGGATRTHGGTGLGLAIVREFVDTMKGRVRVCEAPEGGAAFEVWLPLTAPAGVHVASLSSEFREAPQVMADDLTPRQPPRAKPAGAFRGDELRSLVLVVEDNPDMAQYVAESLEGVARVAVASDGLQGLSMARELKPDVIVTDVMMPRMSGDMLVSALAREPAMARIRTVVLTAKTDDAFRAWMLEHGAHDFLTKPFVVGELRARVQHQIRIRQREEAHDAETRRHDAAMKAMAAQMHQHQKMEAIGRLAGGVAHDFNNLLTVIGGYASLLADAPSDPEFVRELASEIKGAGDRAASLTRQLLTFGRKQVLQPRDTDVQQVLSDLDKTLRQLVGERVSLGVEIVGGPHVVSIDPTQLDQVLINLVVNARDAMPDGGRLSILVSERTRETVPAGDVPAPGVSPDARWIMLEVRDTGVGVAGETLDRIFEPFFSTKEMGKGTGLGLAIVHGIVQQSGGCVTCESELGTGTVFRLFFPSAGASASDRAATRASHSVQARPGTPVLVVDDDPMVREFTARSLRKLNYEVALADDGAEALRKLADRAATATPFELVVTDITMPGMSGGALSDEIEARWPGVPVIFVSGYADDPAVRHTLGRPDSLFLQKPFSVSALQEAAARALSTQ